MYIFSKEEERSMIKTIKKKVLITGMISMALLGGLGGTMTSYAAGPGETTQAVAKPVTYNQQSVKALGSWEAQSNGTWKFKCLDGTYQTNSWIESLAEVGAYYFVGTDGVMLFNCKTPDGYTVDGNGLWRSGVKTAGSNMSDSSSVNDTGSRAETGKTTGRAEERLTQEYLDFVKEHTKGYTPANLH